MENKNNNKCTVTVFVLATNETELLEETISQMYALRNFDCIEKIIIVTKNDHCPAYEYGKRIISGLSDKKVEIYVQKATRFELCYLELAPLVKTTHYIYTAADMEMYPPTIDTFIDKAKQHPRRIISATKWHKDSVVEGYGALHKLTTCTLNFILACITGFKAKDVVSMYRIFPVCLFDELNLSNDINFGYEYAIKPLLMDIEYEEVPTVYKPRTESHSNFNLTKLIYLGGRFIFTAIWLRFKIKKSSKKTISKR